MTANEESLSRVMANASMGAAKASPVSTQTGMASTTQADWTAPNADITIRKIVLFMASRMVVNSR